MPSASPMFSRLTSQWSQPSLCSRWKCRGDAVDDALEFLAAELLRQTRCVLHDEPGRAVRRFAAFVPLGHEAGQRLVLDELAFAEELVARGRGLRAIVDLDDGDGEGCGGPMDETDRS